MTHVFTPEPVSSLRTIRRSSRIRPQPLVLASMVVALVVVVYARGITTNDVQRLFTPPAVPQNPDEMRFRKLEREVAELKAALDRR